MNPPCCPQCGGPSREDLPYCIYCRSLLPSYSPSIKNNFKRVAYYSDYSPSVEYSRSATASPSAYWSASPSEEYDDGHYVAYTGASPYSYAWKNTTVFDDTPVDKSIWKRILRTFRK